MENNLVKFRKLKGMSQTELSEEANVGRTTIYLIEKGKTNPSVSTAKKIAEALKVDVKEIFFNDIA